MHQHLFRVQPSSSTVIYFKCDCGQKCQVWRNTYNMLVKGQVKYWGAAYGKLPEPSPTWTRFDIDSNAEYPAGIEDMLTSLREYGHRNSLRFNDSYVDDDGRLIVTWTKIEKLPPASNWATDLIEDAYRIRSEAGL